MGQTRNFRDGAIAIEDGTTPTANTVTLTLEMGDLTFTERKEYVQVDDRGALDHVRNGNQVPVPLSFSVKVDRVSEASSPVTLRDALAGLRSASSWVSVASAWEPYAVKVVFTVSDPDTVTGDDEVITFAKFFPEEIEFAEGDDTNTVGASGFSYEEKPAYS